MSKQAAHQAVAQAMKRIANEISERADELRALESEKLDAAAAALWPKVLQGDTRAHDSWLRNRARYSALLNLDLRPNPNPDSGVEFHVHVGLPAEARVEVADGEAEPIREVGTGTCSANPLYEAR